MSAGSHYQHHALAAPPTPLSKTASEIALRQAKCRYKQYDCTLPRLDGFSYCLQHILEDKTAPYKGCSFVNSLNGRTCSKPAYKGDRRNNGLCLLHARKDEIKRQKSSARHYPPPSTESYLVGLGHHVGLHTSHIADNSTKVDVDEPPDPFVNMDAASINSSMSRILDYASESDSDVETAMLDLTWKGGDADADSSDAESVDSEQDDPLKHAGVYTAEEALQVTKEKLIRLQSLYIEQFRRLQHVLREQRRRYLHSLKREKESLCSISSQARTSAREQKLYDKLRAFNHYHRRNGIEAVLHKKALERRASVTDGMSVRPAPFPKCVYTEGGVKCGARSLPVSKFCPKHILQDTLQVLFRPCGCKMDSDLECREPLPDITEGAYCVYHTVLPPFQKTKIEKEEPLHETTELEENHQQEQLQQLTQQLEHHFEQVSHGLALPDQLVSDMDIVLDEKNERNYLGSF